MTLSLSLSLSLSSWPLCSHSRDNPLSVCWKHIPLLINFTVTFTKTKKTLMLTYRKGGPWWFPTNNGGMERGVGGPWLRVFSVFFELGCG
jgi:hypothetical protein